MSAPHTTLAISGIYMVDPIKVNREINDFLGAAYKLSEARYGNLRYSHAALHRFIIGPAGFTSEVGQPGSACAYLNEDETALSEVNVATELMLGCLLCLAEMHPAIELTVNTSAPASLLRGALRVAQAYNASVPRPDWISDLHEGDLDRQVIPCSLDFRG